MNIKNIHEILLPRTIVLDAKSMDLYKKLKCEVCGSEDLIVGKQKINRGFTNCIVVSVFCNNCENWQEVIINDFDQNKSYNDIVKDLEALEREKEQLYTELSIKLKEDLLKNKKTKKEKAWIHFDICLAG